MNKISLLAAGAALAFSASANAWWGGPADSMSDWFGDGAGDFNMSFSGRGHGYGRGYDYYAPYYYGYPYNGYVPAPQVLGAQPAAVQQNADSLKNFHEEQMKAFQEAAEAQRQFVERALPPMPMHGSMQERFQAADERRQAMRQQMEQMRPATPFANMDQAIEERMKAAEQRREEMLKQMEALRPDRAHPASPSQETRMKAVEDRRAAMRKAMDERRTRIMGSNPVQAPIPAFNNS